MASTTIEVTVSLSHEDTERIMEAVPRQFILGGRRWGRTQIQAEWLSRYRGNPGFVGIDPGVPEGDQAAVVVGQLDGNALTVTDVLTSDSPPENARAVRWCLDNPRVQWERNYLGEWPQPATEPPLTQTIHQDWPGTESPYTRTFDPEADARAEQLLLENLSDDQRGCYQKYHCFFVTAPSGRAYRINRWRAYNVHRLKSGKVAYYCLQPTDPAIPLADQLLSQKLLLEANEAYFLQTANVR